MNGAVDVYMLYLMSIRHLGSPKYTEGNRLRHGRVSRRHVSMESLKEICDEDDGAAMIAAAE